MSGLLSPLRPTIWEGEAAWLAFDSRVMRQPSQQGGPGTTMSVQSLAPLRLCAHFCRRHQSPGSLHHAFNGRLMLGSKMQKDLGRQAKVLGKRQGERIFMERRYSREQCGAVFQKQAILEG